MKQTLAVVGSHPNAKDFDFERTDCDVWGFNEVMAQGWFKRADAIFQMHLEPIWRNPQNRNDNGHFAWLTSGNTPTIIMQDKYPDVPKSERYPLEDVEKLVRRFAWQNKDGKTGKLYLTSTIAMAIALGIVKGYERIELWGCEMETDTEYRYQRDGVTFWLGVAVGNNIVVEANTNIFNSPMYGYEGEAELKETEFADRIEALQPGIEELLEKYNTSLATTQKELAAFINSGKNAEAVVEAIRVQVQAGFEYGLHSGAIQENDRYKAKAEAMKQTAGDFQFSRQEFEASAQRLAQERENLQASVNVDAGVCEAKFGEAAKEKNAYRRKNKTELFSPYASRYIENSIKLGVITGAMIENQTYLKRLDTLIRAAGGAKSEAVLLGKEVENVAV